MENSLNVTSNHFIFNHMQQSKAQRTMLTIMEAAIKCYAIHGIEKTTYAKIAFESKVSRTLIIHYFPNQLDLFLQAIKLIRVHMQNYLIEKMSKGVGPKKKLENYIDGTFQWLNENKHYSQVWILYYFHCSSNTEAKKMNTEFSNIGRERIEDLIKSAIAQNEVACSKPKRAAQQILSIVAGALISFVSENLSNRSQFQSDVKKICLGLLTNI